MFESFYYTLARFAFICSTFILAQYSQSLITQDNNDGRFANQWVVVCICANLVLLIDLFLHFLCYGPWTILKQNKSFMWEAVLQLVFLICIIVYYSFDMGMVS